MKLHRPKPMGRKPGFSTSTKHFGNGGKSKKGCKS